MAKSNNILNQLAVIADLLEKIEIDSSIITVTFNLKNKDFTNFFAKIAQRSGIATKTTNDDVFILKIGNVDYLFNRNNA